MTDPAPRFHVVDRRSSPDSSPTPNPLTTITPDDRRATLDAIRTHIGRYVYLSPAQLDTLTIWTAHTHAIDAADCTPYIAVMSTAKRSGKTRLLEVLEPLVNNPLRTADVTEAALFRNLNGQSHTVMLDEIDTVFGGGKSREGLRALLNASYRRGSLVHRVDGAYEVFGPKVIAGIGELPDTVADRSIRIQMVRKPSGRDDAIHRYNARYVHKVITQLRDELAWSFGPHRDNRSYLRELVNATPWLPGWLNDRAQDSWEPLLGIAESIGGNWLDRLWVASKELSGEVRTVADELRDRQ